MLLSLHVRNMALIDEEEVTFGEGLNILTGETGAGKSIIIGSIAVALGAKADHELIRQGADYALVELTFSSDTPQLQEKLRELDLPDEEDGLILIKRKIMPTRSTATVNGESVTARQLRDLAEVLLDIYGQRENQRLLQKNQQMAVLDEYAGEPAARLLEQLSPLCRRLRKMQKEWEEQDLDENARQRETDLLTYELNEIEDAQLRAGEDEELENRYRLLSNYRKIEEAVNLAIGLVDGDGYQERDSASSQIGRALREISSVSGL
ncbi:MAG: AAA family ATPase, partial [Lachnospiraceae bacterium]|nr:AAA family ATPase [Lachnospiraceae bacterium]